MYRVATGLGWGWAVADCLAVPAGPCPNYRPAHRHPRKQLAADRPRGGKRTGSLHWRRTARPSARPANRCPTHRKKSHILQARRSNIIKNNEFGSTFHFRPEKPYDVVFPTSRTSSTSSCPSSCASSCTSSYASCASSHATSSLETASYCRAVWPLGWAAAGSLTASPTDRPVSHLSSCASSSTRSDWQLTGRVVANGLNRRTGG